MRINLAKTAGFCFGVERAVNKVNDYVAQGQPVCTLGPLIHNPGFIRSLESKGVYIAQDAADVRPGYKLIIRTHGVTKDVMADIVSRGIDYDDATCPFVQKIHKIVAERSAAGDVILIAGDENHPEVVGIRSCAVTPSFVFSSTQELEKIAGSGSFSPDCAVTMVSQTTFDAKEFKNSEKFAKKLYTNLKIFDTICNATALRQEEAERISAENDIMIVIGGRNSSNTAKLHKICSAHCRTDLI